MTIANATITSIDNQTFVDANTTQNLSDNKTIGTVINETQVINDTSKSKEIAVT